MITLSKDTTGACSSHDLAVQTFRPIEPVCRRVQAIQDWSSQTVLGLVPLVEASPILTTTILRAANLPLYGLKSKISTLSHAMAMLGVPALRHLLTGAIRNPTVPDQQEISRRAQSWRHAMITAVLARAFGVKRSYDLPEEAYVAGLLHDLEDLIYRSIEPESETDRGEIEHSLRRDPGSRNSRILADWHLPPILVNSVRLRTADEEERDEFDPKTFELAGLLDTAEKAATLLADRLPAQIDDSSKFVDLSHALEISSDELIEALHSARNHLSGILESLGYPTQDESDLFHDLFETAGGGNGEGAMQPAAEAETTEEGAVSSLQIVHNGLNDLRKSQSASNIIDRVMDIAHREFRFERVLYFHHEETRGELTGAKIMDDSWRAVDPAEVKIVIRELGSALTDCINSRCGIAIDQDSPGEEILRYFGVEQIGILPVIQENAVSGLLFVDHFYSRKPISAEIMTSLEILCSEASLLLENLKLSSESKALKKFAEKDELTNLNNRRYCIELCRKEVERAHRYDTPLTLVMIDVDNFKEINDTFGHQVGDHVLREVAALIERNSRRSDIIGRYGGDEFIVLLPEIPAEQAIVYAERMRNRVEQLRLELNELTPGLSFAISLGVGSLKEEDENFDDLVARVDKALYAAKNRGRNRVCVG